MSGGPQTSQQVASGLFPTLKGCFAVLYSFPTMASLPIMIDGDSGGDGAIALLLALTTPELDVLGITTVTRNMQMH